MEDDKKKVESILFTTGRFMNIEEIAKICGIGSVGYIKEVLQALMDEYKTKGSALTIQEHEGKYKLNIKKEYGYLANKVLEDSEMDSPTTKTLAIIAYKAPVLQAEVIKIRGNKAYEHIHILKENGLVNSERAGRSRMLKLTPKFFDYFDVAEKEMKENMDKLAPPALQETDAEEQQKKVVNLTENAIPAHND